MISQILIVMIAAIAVTIFAEGRNIQPPLLLALVGVAASFIPGLPPLELEPDIILAVVLPPLLYSAATEFSVVSFMQRLRPILSLGVALVVATTFLVGAVASLVIPGLPIAAAIVLAAVVSPPDAVTAVAVGRKLGLPRAMMTVLKGESLINDAAALTLFTFATATVTGTHLFIENGVLYFGYAALVGVLIGALIGGFASHIQRQLSNPALATILSVLVPFTAYMVAEELSASGVLAVVAAGFVVGHNSSRAGYASRIQERQFWRTTDALLEAFVFAYIGLQLRFVLDDAAAAGHDAVQVAVLSSAVLVAVIAVRIAWVFATSALHRWRSNGKQRWLQRRIEAGDPRTLAVMNGAPPGSPQRRGKFEDHPPFGWRENLVIAWTGMRGVVTLAAAAGIPLTTLAGEPFPGRDIIQAVAFVVTIGTLLLQGLTLPWLIGVLKITDPADEAERAAQRDRADRIVRQATRDSVAAYRAAHPGQEAQMATENMLQRIKQSDQQGDELRTEGTGMMLALGRQMLEDRRAALIAARDKRELDDETLREVLEEIDLQQATFALIDKERI